MLRKAFAWAVLAGVGIPLWAAERPASISGYVRSTTGIPQMGAVVEILGAASRHLTVFTDGAGFYSAAGLLPGTYAVQVSAPSFLPALREKISLNSGAALSLNLTLKSLLEAVRLGPVRANTDDDGWKWALRSVASRPVLRIFDDPSAPKEKQVRDIKTQLSFLAGSVGDGYGSGSDVNTGFALETSLFANGTVGLSGNLGYGDGVPDGILRTTYKRHLMNGSEPSMALTVRRFAPSDPNLRNSALQALTFSAADDIAIGDVLELKFGSELQAIQFLGHMNAIRPYGAADLHLSPNTVLEYSFTTSLPRTRGEKGFDSSPADRTETDPRVSLTGFSPRLESAHHQELSLSRRLGGTSVQAAVFTDRISNTALTGVGLVNAAGGELLPDIYSGTFSYAGGRLDTQGMRVVLERKFSADLTATLDYAYGGVLDLTRPDVSVGDAHRWISTQRRHAVAAKFSGALPRTHTKWIASYRWVNGPALTPVDMFNASPGQADPYLNLFIRQPIPTLGFLPHMEALIDLRNLLAQGYVPVVGQDGQTVYLVQSARSVRGGVAFSF